MRLEADGRSWIDVSDEWDEDTVPDRDHPLQPELEFDELAALFQ